MPRTKIICIGSPFGDDQFGAWAYEQLRPVIDPSAAQLLYLDRPGARLIGALDGVDQLILIDAVKSGAAIGSVVHIEGAEIYRHFARHTSTHGFGVVDALQLAQRLGNMPPSVVLLGVEVGATNAASTLSDAVRGALPALLRTLDAVLVARTSDSESTIP